jgi:2,3-bisphosphoglycerate-dependent phosphoglycerate mutase
MARLVLVRHGQSEYNLKNLFTGWVDAALTSKGEEEARKSALILKEKNFIPQIAFTSALQRAQKTLQIILDEIKVSSLPIHKDKALNERDYGELNGKNKAQTAEKFGEEQVKVWRRSFDVRPPGGESLKDTAARTLPYFQSKILPEVKAGKDVLVVAHGNSLRSIVMDIEKLTPDEILKRELATGEAVIYEF